MLFSVNGQQIFELVIFIVIASFVLKAMKLALGGRAGGNEKVCQGCGAGNPRNARFCRQCGRKYE